MTIRNALLVRTSSIDYATSWELQRAIASARREGSIPDVVWMLEHPPVFTVGRHGTRADLFLSDDVLATMGATFHQIDRGGQMTWHGPGQSVVYPICDLRGGRVRTFIEALVGAMNDAAAIPGAAAGVEAMGLYVAGRKLGSVGIRVEEGISTHGLALNRDPDMEWFSVMTACGAPGVETTSIAREGGDPTRQRVDDALAEALAERLAMNLEEVGLHDLPIPAGAPRR